MISAKEIAYAIHTCDNEKFAEIFAYLQKMHKGELGQLRDEQAALEKMTLSAEYMLEFGKTIDSLTHWIGNNLWEVINEPDIATDAWWKTPDQF